MLRPIALALALAVTAAVGAGVGPAPTASAQDAGSDPLSDMIEKMRVEEEEHARASHEKERTDRAALGTRGDWAVSDDGSMIAAGTPAGKIEVWNRGDAKPAFVLEGHPDLVVSLAFRHDSPTLYSVGYEGMLRTWDLEKRELVGTLGEPSRKPTKSAKESLLASAGRYWHVDTSPDGRYFVAPRMFLAIWDTQTRKWLESLPMTMSPLVLFLADSRRYLVDSMEGVALHDLEAPPVKSASDGELDAAKPIWRLRSERKGGLDFSAPSAKPKTTELGDALFSMVTVIDSAATVVTLSTYRSADPKAALTAPWRKVLRGWDAKTGARRWEKKVAENSFLHHARAAALVAVGTQTGIDFHSPKDGSRVRTHSFAKGSPVPAILSPDASVGFAADKDGNLIEISLAPPAAPATPTAPGAPTPPK